jgi:hypothetical protein
MLSCAGDDQNPVQTNEPLLGEEIGDTSGPLRRGSREIIPVG